GRTRGPPRSTSASRGPADRDPTPMVTQERPRVRGVEDWRPRPTLTGADYTSAVVYEEERERLFFRGWLCVGRSEEIAEPGTYLVRDVVGESVFVVRNSNETITDFERYRMGELRLGRRLTYDVAANWKIVVENYNECLHCPTIHPELVQVIPLFRKGEVWDGETADGGNLMIEGATSFTATGVSDLPRFPGLLDPDYGMYYGVFQFPNLMVNL